MTETDIDLTGLEPLCRFLNVESRGGPKGVALMWRCEYCRVGRPWEGVLSDQPHDY